MKRHGPPNGSGPGSEANLRIAGEHPPTRSDTGRASSPSQSNSSAQHAAAPLRIVIVPTPSGRKWTARLGERVLCVSAWPFVKSARLLLTEGYPADAFIEMWRPNSDAWALRGRLGAVAATVIDGETAPRCAKNDPPVRDTEPGGQQRAGDGSRSPSPRSWRK
jgi:hypothetical protein